MRRCVVVVQYNTLVSHPPTMSLLLSLQSLGRDVYSISVDHPAARRFVEEHNIPASFFPSDWLPQKTKGWFARVVSVLWRATRFYSKRLALKKILAELQSKYDELELWFQEVNSAALLGNDYVRYPRRALTLFEIDDVYGCKWWGFDFERFMRTTVIVVPEYNRSFIVECIYHLTERPLVLTNKPANHPRKSKIPLSEELEQVFRGVGSRPVFLYQGVWGGDRDGVGRILEVIAKNRPQYAVMSLPDSAEARQRLGKYENAFLLPYIPAPGHLAVTSRATVGIAVYGGGSAPLYRLNALYCAPNKIFEYAGFGVPTLGNDIPGLKYSIEANGAGVCCELTDESILNAADLLISNIDKYRQGASAFFEKTNTNHEVSAILSRMERDSK